MSRSLVACTRCRGLKVRCAGNSPCQRCQRSGVGAQCTFVQPRQAIRPQTHDNDRPLEQGNQLERTEHLERQVAELTRSSNAVLKELRGDIIDLNRRVARASTSPHIVTDHGAGTDYGASNYTPASARWPLHAPSLPAEHDTTLNIVEKGIIEDLQCHELFKFFHEHCNDTISFLDNIDSSLENVRRTPVLLATVCSVGAKASGSRLYDICKAEAEFQIQQTMFNTAPSLEVVKGILIYAAWYRSTRICGHLLSIAYELGLHSAAENLASTEIEMSEHDVDMARTWLSFCCTDLLMNLSGPILVSNYERYLNLGAVLCASRHSRTVDYRIMANIELFGTVEKARSLRLNVNCSKPLPGDVLVAIKSLTAELDVWLSKVNTDVEPLYQTYSKPQDRNRMIIPYAAIRMYVNGITVHQALPESSVDPTHYPIIKTAIEAGIAVLETAIGSQNFHENLRYTIGYNSNALYHAINFLHKAALMVHRHIAINNIVEVFCRVVQMLDSANVPDHAQNVREKLNRLSQIAVSPPSSRLNQATNSDLMKLGKGDDMLNDILWDQFPLSDGFAIEYPVGSFATPPPY